MMIMIAHVNSQVWWAHLPAIRLVSETWWFEDGNYVAYDGNHNGNYDGNYDGNCDEYFNGNCHGNLYENTLEIMIKT